jgi:hypothetical protein
VMEELDIVIQKATNRIVLPLCCMVTVLEGLHTWKSGNNFKNLSLNSVLVYHCLLFFHPKRLLLGE